MKCTNLTSMDTEETFFLALKSHRESNGITLDEISEFTKINPKYVNAIEEGNFNIIPNIYMRLFIRSYVKYIGADHNQALADYELYTTGKIQPKFAETNDSISVQEKSAPSNNINEIGKEFQVNYTQIIKIAFAILIIFIAFFIVKTISEEEQKNPNNTFLKTTSHLIS